MNRIDIVKGIVGEAGKKALNYFGKTTGSLKSDKTIVTEADIEIGEFLTARLLDEFPEYGFVNEEMDENQPDSVLSNDLSIENNNKYTWIIDPIDGTSSFYCRLPVWCIAVGLLRGIEPVLGMIHIPVMDEFYYTDEDIPAYFESKRWGKKIMDISRRDDDFTGESFIAIVSTANKRLKINFPGKSRALGSNSANFCYVSRGDAVGGIVRGHLWDLVMGTAILKKAGGIIVPLDGNTLDLQKLLDRDSLSGFNIIGSPLNVKKISYIVSIADLQTRQEPP